MNGRLLLSLPLHRGDTDDSHRDHNGRLFTPYTPDQIDDFRDQGAYGGLTAWYLQQQTNTKKNSTTAKQHKAVKAIAETIVAGPVTHTG